MVTAHGSSLSRPHRSSPWACGRLTQRRCHSPSPVHLLLAFPNHPSSHATLTVDFSRYNQPTVNSRRVGLRSRLVVPGYCIPGIIYVHPVGQPKKMLEQTLYFPSGLLLLTRLFLFVILQTHHVSCKRCSREILSSLHHACFFITSSANHTLPCARLAPATLAPMPRT